MCIIITERGKWSNEAFEKTMDVIESGKTSLKQTNIHWNIPCTFLSNHLNGKTRSRKCGPTSVLIEEKKDEVIVTSTLVV
jgi:hypothetical protein